MRREVKEVAKASKPVSVPSSTGTPAARSSAASPGLSPAETFETTANGLVVDLHASIAIAR